MQIRTATVADLPSLIELERTCSTAAHWAERQYAQLFETAETAPQRLALVATASEPSAGEIHGHLQPPLGSLVARRVASEWELENIVVASHARRKGLGTRLLQALFDHAKQANGESVFLEVRESNTAARALYENAGFKPTGRRQSYYANPSEDAILYRRDLH